MFICNTISLIVYWTITENLLPTAYFIGRDCECKIMSIGMMNGKQKWNRRNLDKEIGTQWFQSMRVIRNQMSKVKYILAYTRY